ncbi:MAG: hypothetical protein AAGK04_03860, partial [Planctomycetota bacterium]
MEGPIVLRANRAHVWTEPARVAPGGRELHTTQRLFLEGDVMVQLGPFDRFASRSAAVWLKRIDDIDAGRNGEVWLATRRTINRTTVARRDGNGTWRVFTEAEGLPTSSMLSALADRDGGFWGGSSSDGLVRIDPEGAVTVFDTENSSILSGLSNPDFVPVVDATFDGKGRPVHAPTSSRT